MIPVLTERLLHHAKPQLTGQGPDDAQPEMEATRSVF
jgi:hypothetical protein